VILALLLACAIDGGLPDPSCTPGLASDATLETVCTQHTGTVRHVTEATKKKILKAYGVKNPKPGRYEIDHLIPLELGGSNDVTNLWPQPAPAFHQKDKLEGELHRMVCEHIIPLDQAQKGIAADWLQLYSTWVDGP